MNIFRDDKRYIEIENIKKYELTNCIAFEMAIRNKIVQKSILEYLAIINIDDYKYCDILFRELGIVLLIKEYFNIKSKKEFVTKIHEIMLKDKFYLDIDTVKSFNKEIIDFIYKTINTEFIIEDEFDEFDYEDEDYEKTKFTKIDNDQFDKLNYTLYNEPSSNDISYFYDCNSHYNYVDKDETNRLRNNIIQKFSRPKLTIKPNLKNTVNLIDLNLNIPLDEILEYVKNIYNYYENSKPLSYAYIQSSEGSDSIEELLFWKENTFYKTFKVNEIEKNLNLDIDNEEFDLKSYLKNFKVLYDDNDVSKKKEKINTIKTSKDWADCFFIYDYIKFSKTFNSKNEKIRFIIENLEEYYGESKLKRSAIMDRFNLMQTYIDNLKYKELLSG